MVDRIKRLSKEKKAVKIEALARKIDGHIRKNYRSMLERYLE
jgi:hypothetical protein